MSEHFDDIAATQLLPGRQSHFVDVPRAPNACALPAVLLRIVTQIGEPWRGGVELTSRKSLSHKVYLEIDLTSAFSRESLDVIAATESAMPPVAKPKFRVH